MTLQTAVQKDTILSARSIYMYKYLKEIKNDDQHYYRCLTYCSFFNWETQGNSSFSPAVIHFHSTIYRLEEPILHLLWGS